MRVSLRPIVLGAVLALGLSVAGCKDDEGADRPPPASGAPNFVLVVTDDQERGSMDAMPRTQRLLSGRGAAFTEYFNSYPLCCPSRTSTWTGQYAHNHGVTGNFPDDDGGGYVNLIEPDRVLPKWLRSGGYETVHVGKWASVPGRIPPEGWDRWFGTAQETSARYYDYQLLDAQGRPSPYGQADDDYHTDVVTRTAAEEIDRLADGDRPFLLSVAYLAPHVGTGRDDEATDRCNPRGEPIAPVPAARHANAFEDASLPAPPSFNERDITDKVGDVPNPVGERNKAKLLLEYQCRLASLQAVDQGVAGLVGALEASGELADTYFMFTSDNGFLLGEHRYKGRKNLPYDESTRVPLLVRGPGIKQGAEMTSPAMNVDLAPTILELAGIEPPPRLERPRDGLSLGPILHGESEWPDRAILIEGRTDTDRTHDRFSVESYRGVRTKRYLLLRKFIKSVDSLEEGAAAGFGGRLIGSELYDRDNDPFELENVADDLAYEAIAGRLGRTLDRLADCEGGDCDVRISLPEPEGA